MKKKIKSQKEISLEKQKLYDTMIHFIINRVEDETRFVSHQLTEMLRRQKNKHAREKTVFKIISSTFKVLALSEMYEEFVFESDCLEENNE